MKSGRRPAHEEMNLQRGFITTRQLSNLTGVSLDMLGWWARSEFISTAFVVGKDRGSRRVFLERVAVSQVTKLLEAIRACPYEHKT